MSYSTCPSTDAQRHYTPLWDAAQQAQRQAWEDERCAMAACAALRDIPMHRWSCGVLAHIASTLHACITHAPLRANAHEVAQNYLSDLAQDMDYFAQQEP